jgi:hypothetical protein
MNLNIVIAFYNNQNYINLLKVFDYSLIKYKAIIYNKSPNEIKIPNENCSSQFLNNIGREGETYLNHIINNYDNLSDYTLFIQDDTHNHIKNYNNFIQFCKDIMEKTIPFQLYPCSWREKGIIVSRTINNGIYALNTFPSSDAIKKCCEFNNIFLPKQYTTETCAFFICHKNTILKHEKEFYIKLRNWLLMNEKNGFVLEHIWKLIFV